MSKKQKKQPKRKPGTRHTTVGNVYEGGAADLHPVSRKDQRLPANTGEPLSDSGQGLHSGIPIPPGSLVALPAQDGYDPKTEEVD